MPPAGRVHFFAFQNESNDGCLSLLLIMITQSEDQKKRMILTNIGVLINLTFSMIKIECSRKMNEKS